MLFSRRERLERSQIASFAGFRIPLARIEPVAGFELADHRGVNRAGGPRFLAAFAQAARFWTVN